MGESDHLFVDSEAYHEQMGPTPIVIVVTQTYMEKMFNKNIEIGGQSAVFHLCQRALVPLLQNDRGPNATASI